MQNKFVRYGSHVLCRIILYGYVLLLGYLSTPITVYIISKLFFGNSYISKIDTPTNLNFLVRGILEDFNALEDNKIVSFEPTKDGRPIEILEWEKKSDILLGEAYPRIKSCKIYLQPHMDYDTLRETLIHEYLHCMGYMHVEYDPQDLMYPSQEKGNKEQNIKDYARSLRNRYGK